MALDETFQGVVCCCLDTDSSVRESILKWLDLGDVRSVHQNVSCYPLELSNKYYKATIHLFDLNDKSLQDDSKPSRREDFLASSQAVILYGDGLKLTTKQLDIKLDALKTVKGEPRILLCDTIDHECESYKGLLDWSIKNGYDLIHLGDEEAKKDTINSLSAYKWTHRSNVSENNPELDQEVLRKLVDFDNLLGKLNAYRDQPELRGNPDDKNIMEIAQILTGLLGDDVDNFLVEEEEDNGLEANNQSQSTSNATNNESEHASH